MQLCSPPEHTGTSVPPSEPLAPPLPPAPPVPPLPPLPVVPASGGGEEMPHAPCVAPEGTRHVRPAQQSAVAAQVPPVPLQVGPPSVGGGGGGGGGVVMHVPGS